MNFAGLDAHLAYVTVGIVDKSGAVLAQRNVRTRVPEELVTLLQAHAPIEAVVETCPFWPWIYDLLTSAGIRVHLAHAKELRAIAASHRKTDERDAVLLGRMLATGLIPSVHPKSPDQREVATLLRHRALLVQQRTACANRIHAQLHQRRLHLGRAKLRRQTSSAWLKEVAWPQLSREQRRLIASQWRFMQILTRLVRALDRVIARHAAASPAATVLRTIPGIGPYRSLVLATELTPIRRFARPKYLVSYAGLAPLTRSSGGHIRRGAIPRGANRAVRGALVSAVVNHIRLAPESTLSAYYERLKPRVGWPIARVATARRLAHVVHRMLDTGETWRG